jgi:hypothetical protein
MIAMILTGLLVLSASPFSATSAQAAAPGNSADDELDQLSKEVESAPASTPAPPAVQTPTSGYPGSSGSGSPLTMPQGLDSGKSASGGSFSRFTWSVRGSVPLLASASAGVFFPLALDEETGLDFGPAILFQVEGGYGGGKASVGWAGVSNDYHGGAFGKVFGLDVKASVLRAWNKPRGDFQSGEVYGGIELDAHYILKFSVGVMKQLTGHSVSSWNLTAGAGFGFL